MRVFQDVEGIVLTWMTVLVCVLKWKEQEIVAWCGILRGALCYKVSLSGNMSGLPEHVFLVISTVNTLMTVRYLHLLS